MYDLYTVLHVRFIIFCKMWIYELKDVTVFFSFTNFEGENMLCIQIKFLIIKPKHNCYWNDFL